MKFLKLSAALLIMVNALLLFSCSKIDEHTPIVDGIPHDTIPEDTTVPLLTKVWYSSTLADTANTPLYKDSIYYNDKQQIAQVISYGSSTPITYTFAYYNDGSLASLAVHGGASLLRLKYDLVYKNNRVDSIIYRDSIGAPWMMVAKLLYNEQGKLLNLTSYLEDMGQFFVAYKIDYARDTTGTVDSVHTESMLGTSVGAHTTDPSATISPVNQVWQRFDKAYLFILATRVQNQLFSPGDNNLFLYQFLSAEDNFFNDGIFNTYSTRFGNLYQFYSIGYTLNADSTLNTYQYYQAARELIGAKFFYIRK